MAFPTMGTSAASANPIAPDPSHTQSVSKEGFSNPDQDNPAKGNRTGVYERNGAKYAPQVNYVYPNEQVSSQTQRNVRRVPSAIGNRDFWAGREQGQDLSGL